MDLAKKAKMSAIMQLIEAMDEMELGKLMPGEEEVEDKMESMAEMKPEKKGITIMKVEAKKPEIEKKEKPEMETEEEEEEIDPFSALARIKKKLAGK